MIQHLPTPRRVAILADNCIAREDTMSGKEIRLDCRLEFIHFATAGADIAYLKDQNQNADSPCLLVSISEIEEIDKFSAAQAVAV